MAGKRTRLSAKDRRRQILRVATVLLARQGYEGTTTRQIAERAGVNEAIIFRHFPHKEDLYWAVIEEKCRENGGDHGLENGRSGRNAEDGEREFFAAIADDILSRNTQDTTLSRLLLFSALEHHKLSDRFFKTYVAQYNEALAGYIRKRIRQGSFRRVQPLLAARGFLGMVIYHFLIQELFGGKRYQKFKARKVSETLADIWLAGMKARDGGRARNGKTSKRR